MKTGDGLVTCFTYAFYVAEFLIMLGFTVSRQHKEKGISSPVEIIHCPLVGQFNCVLMKEMCRNQQM